MACEAVAYARAGLIGNPSDGYFGKTISFVIRDFSARVSLYESPELRIIPSYQDQFQWDNVRDLAQDVRLNGYYGGIRLMKATIKKFLEYCDQHEIAIPADKNFSIRYRSTIPRRLGLGGSSALVTATLRCLMDFYEVEIPKYLQPNVILSVETEELGISAGLQDRVIQVYEGCVYMDFRRELMETRGYGEYVEIDPALLPNLYIAFQNDLGEGSEVFHNNVRERWLQGDPQVVQAMETFAQYAETVYQLLQEGRGREIGPWLNKNFDLRRSLFALNPRHVALVEAARATGASAKYAGSGGAIVGTYEDEAMFSRLQEKLADLGAHVMKPTITAESWASPVM